MDKNRARITIKLNQPKEGQAPKKLERPVVNRELKEQSESREVQEIISDEDQSKPELVQEPESKFEPEPEPKPEPKDFIARDEVAAGNETMDKGKRERFIPDWDVLEEKDHSLSTNRRSYKSRFRNSRENQTKGVLAVAVSVIGAIVLGLVFGFVVLGFFKSGLLDSPSAPSAAVPKVQEVPSAGSQAEPEGNASVEGQAPANSEVQEATTTVSITLPSNTWYVIQGGVFQDEASAGPILEKIKSKGWPNRFVGDKPLHLLLGLAVEREHVLALAAPYKEMDVYIKEWSEETKTVSVAVKQGAETTQEEWDQWFDREEEMVKVLGQAIAEGVTTGKLAEGSMKQVTDAHRSILQQGRELISKLPQENQSLGNRMLNDLSKGVSALQRYQKQPTEGYLWQAEQAILDAYQSKHAFFASFQ